MQAIALFVLMGAACWAQNPIGTWKLRPSKSRFDGPPPKALTVRYDSHGDGEVWTFYQVRADGTSETVSQTLYFDAKEHPCGDLGFAEQPDSVVARKLDARTADVAYKVSGRVARRVLRTLSEDGRQMTLKVCITPEKGPAVERQLVFER